MEALLKYFDEHRGRRRDLALALGITPGAISQWAKVPAERLIEIEKATGIRRQDLRPDLYETGEDAA
jgi:DNA-binding transcriptional regulator YdaS (Cro superfamily)